MRSNCCVEVDPVYAIMSYWCALLLDLLWHVISSDVRNKYIRVLNLLYMFFFSIIGLWWQSIGQKAFDSVRWMVLFYIMDGIILAYPILSYAILYYIENNKIHTIKMNIYPRLFNWYHFKNRRRYLELR